MGDPLMQSRAMTLLEFGCPPMPIANGRRMETDEPLVANSHDLLSAFMAHAFKQQDADFNNERKMRQEAIEEAYYKALLASDGSFQSIYAAMAQYTRDYMGTFLLPPLSVRDVHVLPPDQIQPAMLADIRSYCDAMHIVQYNRPPQEKTPQGLATLLKNCHAMLCERENIANRAAS